MQVSSYLLKICQLGARCSHAKPERTISKSQLAASLCNSDSLSFVPLKFDSGNVFVFYLSQRVTQVPHWLIHSRAFEWPESK